MQNIINYVPKTNEDFTGLEQHGVMVHGGAGNEEAWNCCQTLYLETQRSLENRYTHQNDFKTGHRGRETQGS